MPTTIEKHQKNIEGIMRSLIEDPENNNEEVYGYVETENKR